VEHYWRGGDRRNGNTPGKGIISKELRESERRRETMWRLTALDRKRVGGEKNQRGRVRGGGKGRTKRKINKLRSLCGIAGTKMDFP